MKYGGGSAMFGGCFGGKKLGEIYQVEGIMEKTNCHSILSHQAIPSGRQIFGGEKYTFQQDNDPKHASKLCQNYFQNKSDESISDIMNWPPQSPDLSPIELLWEEM